MDFCVSLYGFIKKNITESYLYNLFLKLDFNWQGSLFYKIFLLPQRALEKLYKMYEDQINESKTKEIILKLKDIDIYLVLAFCALYPLFSDTVLKITILFVCLFYYLSSFILKREFSKIDEFDMFILLFIAVSSLFSSYGKDLFAFTGVLLDFAIMSIYYLNLKNVIITTNSQKLALSLYVLSGLTCASMAYINEEGLKIEGISFFYILCLPIALDLFKIQKGVIKKAIALISALIMASSLITQISNYTNPKAAVVMVSFIAVKDIRFFLAGLFIILFLPLFVWEGNLISLKDIEKASKVNRVSIYNTLLNFASSVKNGMSGISRLFGDIAIGAYFMFIIIMLNTVLRKAKNKGGTLKALILAAGTFILYDFGFRGRLIFLIYIALTSLNEEEYGYEKVKQL